MTVSLHKPLSDKQPNIPLYLSDELRVWKSKTKQNDIVWYVLQCYEIWTKAPPYRKEF